MKQQRAGLFVAGMALLFAMSALAGCLDLAAKGTLTVCVQDDHVDEFTAVYVVFDLVEAKRAGDLSATSAAPVTGRDANETGNTTATNATTNETTGTSEPNATSPLGNDTSTPPTGASDCVEVRSTAAPPPAAPGNATNATSSPTPTGDGNASTPTTATPTTTRAASPSYAPASEEPAGEGNATPPPAGGPLGDENETQTDQDWIRFELEEPRTVDLKSFSGGMRALLGSEEVPTGVYNHLRLHIQDAWAVGANGSQVPLEVPSGVVRVNEEFVVEANRESVVIVDFDLEQSLVEAGESGQWVLEPVVHVTVEYPERETAGEATPTGGNASADAYNTSS